MFSVPLNSKKKHICINGHVKSSSCVFLEKLLKRKEKKFFVKYLIDSTPLSWLYTISSVYASNDIKAYATIPKGMMGCGCSLLHRQVHEFSARWKAVPWMPVCVYLKKLLTCLLKFIEYFPGIGIVAYAFTLFLDNLCRNSCIFLDVLAPVVQRADRPIHWIKSLSTG